MYNKFFVEIKNEQKEAEKEEAESEEGEDEEDDGKKIRNWMHLFTCSSSSYMHAELSNSNRIYFFHVCLARLVHSVHSMENSIWIYTIYMQRKM